MSLLSFFFQEAVTRPIFNGLIFFYTLYPDFGVAVVLLVVVIRVLLLPITMGQFNFQEKQSRIQPKIGELKKKFKDDKERFQKEVLQLYEDEKVNPLHIFPFFLSLVVQIGLLIGLFLVLRDGVTTDGFKLLYSFIKPPDEFHTSFLGLLDLAQKNFILAIVAGVSQWVQTKLITPPSIKGDTSFQAVFQKQALWVLPIVTVLVARNFPAALPLSFTAMNLFGILQHEFIKRRKRNAGNQRQYKTSAQGIPGPDGI